MIQFFQAGGFFMAPLLLTSLVSLAFILERGWALRRKNVAPESVEQAIENCRTRKDLPILQAACERAPSALSRLALTAAAHLSWPKADNINALQTRARQEIIRLERGLVVLEIIVGVAPLLGLMGTIQGLMVLFADLGQAGAADTWALARGISIALNTTLFGLAIAIPSLIAWSYYTKKVENFSVELENLLDEFLRRLYRRETGAGVRRKSKAAEARA